MEVCCHLHFLKYHPNTFQQYYIFVDTLTMVWNKEYLMICDTDLIQFSKMLVNAMDNFLLFLRCNLDHQVMDYLTINNLYKIKLWNSLFKEILTYLLNKNKLKIVLLNYK